MKKLIAIIVLAIVSANTYGQYITPVGTAQWFKKNVYFGSDTSNANAIIRTNGKMGIGNNAPQYSLDIDGDFKSIVNGYSLINGVYAHGPNTGVGSQYFNGSSVWYNGVFNDVTKHIANVSYLNTTTHQYQFLNVDSNNVELGYMPDYTNPSVKSSISILSAQGLIEFTGIASNNSTLFRAVNNSNTQLFTLLNNGKVGIGTTNPTETLTLKGSVSTSYTNSGHNYLFLSNSFGHGMAVQDSASGMFESQVVVDPNFVLIKNPIGTNTNRAFFSVYNEDNLIIGYGNSSLNNKSNTIRFDSTSKFCVGIDALLSTPNMQWMDSSYTPRASIYNNGFMALGTASAPQQTLDVAGSAKIDSSLILHGEYYTATDSIFTIPNNISTVIINSPTGFDAATITMPATPYNGQIISIAVGDYGIGTLTISPNSGQAVSSGTPVLHSGSISYRYRMANSTWYRW